MKNFLFIILFTIGCLDPNSDLRNNGTSFFGVFLAYVSPSAGSSKDIAEFSIVSPYSAGVISDTSIAITTPFGTDAKALVAKFTTTGTSVKVGTVTQVSGTTSNDFSKPVSYLVYGNDGTTKTYTVTVTTASTTAKEITLFRFPSQSATGLITGTNISLTVPYGTDSTSLVAAFASTGVNVKVGTTTQVSGITANDFTSPVSYTVTAYDGSTASYTVSVTVASVSSKDITVFSFPAQSTTGTITGTNISVTVPTGTNVTSLIAAFATSGSSVKVGTTTQASGLTVNNFTNPVTYIVTAANGTTQNYVVTVSVATATTPTITSFTPTSGTVGDIVTISGTNFSATAANNTVKINGTSATVSTASATSLTVTVPEGNIGGAITVATTSGTGTSSASFAGELFDTFDGSFNTNKFSYTGTQPTISNGTVTLPSGTGFFSRKFKPPVVIEGRGKVSDSSISYPGVGVNISPSNSSCNFSSAEIGTGWDQTSLYVSDSYYNNGVFTRSSKISTGICETCTFDFKFEILPGSQKIYINGILMRTMSLITTSCSSYIYFLFGSGNLNISNLEYVKITSSEFGGMLSP